MSIPSPTASPAGPLSPSEPISPAVGEGSRAQSLEFLPVSVFAVVMGLAGLSLAWQRAATTLGTPSAVGAVLGWAALAVLAVLAVAYLTKTARFPAAVRAEWRHPVMIAFVPTTSIALLILSTAFLTTAPGMSAALWWVGAAGQLILTVDVLRVWIADERFAPHHVHPAWFIPVVGNLVVPLAGVEHAPADLSWYFFAVGLVYWLPLLALVMGRLVLGGPLPDRLAPTVAILVAPPAVAALAWARLGGSWTDPVARILLGVMLFQLLLLGTQARRLARVPFALSVWAYSFPLAAASTALLVAYGAGRSEGYAWLGAALLAVTTAVVAALIVRTVLAVLRREICRPH